jgi:hypothetical protein
VAESSSSTTHSISIVAIKDEQSRLKVAAALAKVSKSATQEQIHSRLKTLPWIVTKGTNPNRAEQLVGLLEKLGATVEVDPPLTLWDQGVDSEEPGPKEPSGMAEFGAKSPENTAMAPEPIKPGGVFETKGSGMAKTMTSPGSTGPSGSAPTLAPLSLSGMLDKSFEICKNHLGRLFLILAIPVMFMLVIVLAAALIIGLVGFSTDLKSLFSGASGPAIIIGLALVGIGLGIMFFVVTYLSQGAVIHAVSSIYLGRGVSVKESYKFILGKIGKFIFTSLLFMVVLFGSVVSAILVGAAIYFPLEMMFGRGIVLLLLMIMVGSVLLLFPTYIMLKLMLFDKAVVVEDKTYMEALKRSWNLLSGKADSEWPRGYLLRLIILLHIFVAIYLGVTMLFAPVALIIEFAVPKDFSIIGEVIGNIISYAAGIAAQVYFSVCLVVFYYDIRNRKEGFDLEMMAGMN